MSKEKLVPKLRFEGFTKPWKLTKFNEIADVERGLTYHPSDIVEKGGVRVLRSSNIDEDRFITKDDDVFVNENAINIEFSQKQNILITSANGSPHLVGKHAILEQLETPSVHGGFMLLARTASPYFLNASMSSDWYRKFIRYHVAGGGGSIGNIKKSDLEHQLIYIPSKEEQEKIGSFFKKIDEMIQLQQSKVNKVKDIKSAYLSEMFPKEGEKYPKKRFEGFTEPWKLTKFMEIAEVERGLTYHPTDIVEKGGVRVLRSSNIYEDTFITKDDDVFVNENAINIEFSNEKNILITSANGSSRLVGKHAILEQLDTPSVHGGFMLLVRTARPYFLNASMSSDWYRKFIRYNVAGGGGSIGNIKKSDLEHQLIYIPSKEEQEKIGQFFKNLDNQISIEEEKLRKLRKLKQAYLNDMFV